MERLQAVIFDLDGVLADTVHYHFLATKKVADLEGVPFTPEMNEAFQGMSRKHMIKEIVKEAPKAYIESDLDKLAELKNDYYKSYIKSLSSRDILPGMLSFLNELKEADIPMAIASSSSNARTVVARLGIEHFFQIIINAKSIKKMKPDPEIFLTAADRLKVPYDNCVAIEDSWAGITAIKATPMFSVGIGESPAVREADLHITHTQDLTLKRLRDALI
ncbi:beta-phosphoglucomutase [Salipaludibacillus agaradhaerens]|uniref:Beta-phosphoglucomutase n=1 Tax=Salipaludibacillus agaradhaerens TaxID=76935 RepID=A0A9Q4B1C2_SALAG|nr:beta-phosphoglucomutase [Salipaludibacillus agaradhaerens]MCR6096371.1 beta-phosphoglucomutase [Salipaludibacillus agaradhaerens]MCR6114070.1 beta-phosphoglucomutase [Salipaludibacillus agaradhaerens]